MLAAEYLQKIISGSVSFVTHEKRTLHIRHLHIIVFIPLKYVSFAPGASERIHQVL